MPQPLSSLYNSQIVRLLYRGLFTVSFATVQKKKEESYLPSSMHGIQVSRNTYPTQLSNRPLPIFWKAIYYTNIAAASRFVEGLFPHGAKPGCHQHCRRASTPCRFRLCRARRRLDGDRRREGGGTRWQPLASQALLRPGAFFFLAGRNCHGIATSEVSKQRARKPFVFFCEMRRNSSAETLERAQRSFVYARGLRLV